MRLTPRHWAVLDYVAGGLTMVILFATTRRSVEPAALVPRHYAVHYVPVPLAGPVAVLLITGAGLAVALRRRRPVLMLGVLLVGSLVATALAGSNGHALTYFIPVLYVLFPFAATYEKRRDAERVLAAVFVTLLADATVLQVRWGGLGESDLVTVVPLCVIIVWTIGYIVRQRRKYAVRLQDEAASKAVAQERLRIARELHDVVAHSMSVIAVQAGYGQYIIETQPDDARAALGAIQATSREALDEMRRMLGALRQADDVDGPDDAREGAAPAAGEAARDGATPGAPLSAPLFPAPGLADLNRLVARTAGAGVRVDVTRFGSPRDLPASIDMSAYRIIQEALTNVVKHAQTSSCRVLLGYRDDELTIEITDNGAGMPAGELVGAGPAQHRFTARSGTALLSRHGGTGPDVGILDGPQSPPDGVFGQVTSRVPGGGHGIIGMRERVTLLGGEFSAGPLPGYGFRVTARIPLPPSTT